MYRTYKNEIEKNENNFYEERLIPKEREEKTFKTAGDENSNVKITNSPAAALFKDSFFGLETEDILLIGLLLFLFYENCEDNLLIIILVALIFIK